MAKRLIREEAVMLRKGGMFYSEIREKLMVSKSTLSVWLRDFPLTSKQTERMSDVKIKAVEKYRDTMSKIRTIKYQEALSVEKMKLLPISFRDMQIGGLFLYWGEGGKTSKHQVTLSNSDPRVLVFFKKWLLVVFKISVEKIRVRLTLYVGMDVEAETLFWSKKLEIPINQFRKVQIKIGNGKSNFGFKHGTCELVVTDTRTKTAIMAGLEAVGSFF